MEIRMTIPKEFEEHFKFDKFKDSLCRIRFDLSEYINSEGSQDFTPMSGNYEQELADALPAMFASAEPLNDGEVQVYLTPVAIGVAGKKEE